MVIFLLFISADAPATPNGPPANLLANETSPYLRLHVGNPVAWHPWGEAALARAKNENKPIFLSIGYSSCHWCHVMNRESFADAETAKYLNENFVCIKVDREERPDVDGVYMNAVQAITGSGGWPMSVFLLPDGRPFYGGTYFPKVNRTDSAGKVLIPSFRAVAGAILKAWKDQRADLVKQAELIQEALRREGQRGAKPAAAGPLPADLATKAVAEIATRLDPVHGGLASPPRFAPKFPQPSIGLLFLEILAPTATAEMKPVLLMADRMALGGIYDHVGGGFHRYAVDREWVVPHFEKMLYDQAQLLSFYSRLYERTKNPLYARVIRETIGYLKREMLGTDGLFYSALDADSEHEEGKFYVWTKDELVAALAPDADWVGQWMGVAGKPNFEGKHILLPTLPAMEMAKQLSISEAQLLERWNRARETLRQTRERRPRPLTDTKAITSWNALLIVGLADAAASLPDAEIGRLATATLDALLGKVHDSDHRLSRHVINGTAKGTAFADDFAALALACLAVERFETTDSKKAERRKYAEKLMGVLLDLFWDEKRHAFFYTPRDGETLFVRLKEDYDGALPSSNSLAALALVQLFDATRKPLYRERAQQVFASFHQELTQSPGGISAMLRAWHKLRAIDNRTPQQK